MHCVSVLQLLSRRLQTSRSHASLKAMRFTGGKLPQQRTIVTSQASLGYMDTSPPFINKLEFLEPKIEDAIPTYQVVNQNGELVCPSQDPQIDESVLTKMYEKMVMLNVYDQIMYDAQRQGRISFYMQNSGEEAAAIGSAAAMAPSDLVFSQYREAGVLFWRDFPLSQFMGQCYANVDDPAAGKQMPVHYGSKELNFVTISSPLATQMPQAPGAAYALKRTHPGSCVICYFGDGAASEGDAHAAFNFAATLDAPCLFFCRNNGYAISTPIDEQFRGDGIACRGVGYGMLTIRVDGNDLLAVYNVTKKAREISVKESRPVLIEAMSYRVGHHSTSDDSSRYRELSEVKMWNDHYNPITRTKNYMINHRKCWSEEQDKAFRAQCKKEVLKEFVAAENKKKPSPDLLFTDVYDELPTHLQEQQKLMKEHVMKYKENYPLDKHMPLTT